MTYFWKSGLLFLLFSSALMKAQALDVDVTATSAILINATTGKVLYSKNCSKPMYPASCTKVAFALYAIKFHQPLFNRKLICTQNSLKSMSEAQKSKNNFANVPSYVLESDASHMGLKVGEEMRFYDLLEATMVVSADDASNMISEVMGNGSIEKCVEEVNKYLHSIGCTATHFTNPHGLHHPEHVTTAQDLARLCQEAMKEPLFRQMAKKPRFERPKTNKQPGVTLQASNRLIVKGSSGYYPPAVGIKTGYHRRAGYCLAAQADKDGRSLISVIFQCPTVGDRFKDTKKLFEAAFQEKKVTKTLLASGSQSFERGLDGGADVLRTQTQEPLVYSFYPSEEPEARCQLIWKKVELPLQKGQVVGELHLLADGQIVQKTQLFAANNVDETLTHALARKMNLPVLLGLVGLLAILVLFLITKKRR